jgi:flavin reductase (DIM6/NTAB) family NADH-FMN oxidoreductase RutF
MKKSLGAKTFLFPAPVLLVGTYDPEGKPNLMTAAWAGICCSNPPCVAVSLRKATYSYSAMVERKAFTISIPSEAQIKEADYIGIVSGREVNKFVETGLSAIRSELVDAPYAAELSLIIECRLLHTIILGLHTLFVGEIVDVKADTSILGEDGLPEIQKIKPLVFDTAHRDYYGIGPYLGKAFSVGRK